MEQDEAATLTALKSRRKEVLEPLVARHRGQVFKVAGDGVLVEFASAVHAVQCDLQQGMTAANAEIPTGVFILQAIPALLVLLIRRYVPESPRWLAAHGHSERAETVIQEIESKVVARLGGKALPTPRPQAIAAPARVNVATLLSGIYARRTTILWMLWFWYPRFPVLGLACGILGPQGHARAEPNRRRC
jgi:hypothetical protein